MYERYLKEWKLFRQELAKLKRWAELTILRLLTDEEQGFDYTWNKVHPRPIPKLSCTATLFPTPSSKLLHNFDLKNILIPSRFFMSATYAVLLFHYANTFHYSIMLLYIPVKVAFVTHWHHLLQSGLLITFTIDPFSIGWIFTRLLFVDTSCDITDQYCYILEFQ